MTIQRIACRVVQYVVAVALLLDPMLSSEAAPNAGQTTMMATGAVATQQAPNGQSTDPIGPMTIFEEEGYGCLATGGAAIGLTALADSNELILVFGATVTPTTPVALVVAVTGTIFASFCAVGALATPAVLRIFRYYQYDLAPH
jgi:hypothetical protein